VKRFVVTLCNDYLFLMSWDDSEKNHWFQLDSSIRMFVIVTRHQAAGLGAPCYVQVHSTVAHIFVQLKKTDIGVYYR
jgi:hypothetical protein